MLEESYSVFREKSSFSPRLLLVLGSGLGRFADILSHKEVIPYGEIPHLPSSTAPGHKGQFLLGYFEGLPICIMEGRCHYYEGYTPGEVVAPLRLIRKSGAEYLLLTNAAGAIDPAYKAGEFMMLTDHISCFVPSPLRGENAASFGVRFPDMTQVYDPGMCRMMEDAAKETDLPLHKGVYVQLGGPSFETPAEIRLLKNLGADAVGMSTVMEAIAARHAGMKIGAISCLSNMAAGISPNPLSLEEVYETAEKAAPLFRAFLLAFLKKAALSLR